MEKNKALFLGWLAVPVTILTVAKDVVYYHTNPPTYFILGFLAGILLIPLARHEAIEELIG